MKKHPFFLAVVFLIASGFGTVSTPSPKIENIRQLQRMVNGELVGFCSTWATRINGFLRDVGAYHCIAIDNWEPDLETQFYIGGQPVRLDSGNSEVDLVTFIGGPEVPGLIVAKKLPPLVNNKGELLPIWSAGYPTRQTTRYITAGVYSATKDDEGFAVYGVPVAPGMSGSPVLFGWSVVGVMQLTECPREIRFCSLSRGARLDQIRLFLYGE